MKSFAFYSAVIDPEDIARRDHMECFIEEILEDRGYRLEKTEIEFLVSWQLAWFFSRLQFMRAFC